MVAVIGAGFIGMEVAASCRARGLAVTVIEPLAQPLVRGLGETLGAVCADLHRDHGVEMLLGTGVAAIDATGVDLADGRRVDADVVVVGIGAAPVVDWLADSGLRIGDGVECDATLVAAPGVHAIGDVCRFPNPLFDGESMRLEHWTNATEQAMHVAQHLVSGEAREFAPVPFVWSDQYDTKIQSVGRFDAECEMHVAHGSLADRRFVALFGRGDRFVGALGFSQPRFVMQYRRLVAERASWSDALAKAAG
jgi:NADPH-dependent 2,4-dienoyl-CoA reductase/sulfur reductase-like enzyme